MSNKLSYLFAVLAFLVFASPTKAAESTDPAPDGYAFIARFTVKPGSEDRFIDLMTAVGKEVLKEPGCVDWKIFRSPLDPTLFYALEIFEDEAAFRHHLTLPHTKGEAETAFKEILIGRPQIIQPLSPFRKTAAK